MAELLRVTGLVKHYEGFDLGPLDLTVEEGCVTGLVGTNGSGKTTTIKAILGLITADAGTVDLLGVPAGADGPSVQVKASVGVVFDTCPFPAEARVRDVGAMGRVAYERWDARVFSASCKAFGLADQKRVKELSRGMGMKLSLAFALAHDPSLLILDEPTAGLDPMARVEVLDLLRDFMEVPGRGVLLSSHITTDLEKIADVVTCIDNGTVAFSLPKDDICDVAGVARLRTAELDEVLASGLFSTGDLRVRRASYGFDVLVPDRRAFCDRFGGMTCAAASIEDYMALVLKGESR